DLDAIGTGPVAPQLVTDIDLSAPGRHLLLTFDAGGRSALHIGDALCARGWRGHFFIVTNLLGVRTFLAPADIRQLRSCGHLIGSHSHTHPDIFNALSPRRMLEEWHASTDALSQVLGERCATAAVPGGDISPQVLESAAAAGLRALFTSEPWLVPRRVHGCWILGRSTSGWLEPGRRGASRRPPPPIGFLSSPASPCGRNTSCCSRTRPCAALSCRSDRRPPSAAVTGASAASTGRSRKARSTRPTP